MRECVGVEDAEASVEADGEAALILVEGEVVDGGTGDCHVEI